MKNVKDVFVVYKTQYGMWRAFFIVFVYYAVVCPEDKGVIDYCPKEKNVKKQTFL